MDYGLFIQGVIIGLTLAVPVGPISLMCIHRTVTGGRLHGVLSGLGVATADSLYAAVAFLGLTAISGVIIGNQFLFRFLAGAALVVVGIQVFRSIPATVGDANDQGSYLHDFLSLLTIAGANPLTIIFFITILPGFGVVAEGTAPVASLLFVGGVFLGSVSWWILLCGSVGTVRSRLTPENLQRINHIAGILITGFGAGMLLLLFALPELIP
jgi:threonine/homoserine/homoserine lactone efflux protein